MSRILGFWIALLLIFGGGMLIWTFQRSQEPPPPIVAPGPKMSEFELVDQMGQRLNSKELLGKVWTGSFFFCSCPSTCYQQNMRVSEIQTRFAPQGLMSVSITCDPGNDTPAELARYAARFNADAKTWKFMTPSDADMNYIEQIASDYFGVAVKEETHTDRVMVVDREGKIRGSFSVLEPKQFEKLQDLVAELLADANGTQEGESGSETEPRQESDPESSSESAGNLGEEVSSAARSAAT